MTTLVDPTAFRTVFAAPGETIVLALVARDHNDTLASLADAVQSLRKGGVALKLVVFGDSSAALPGHGDVGFIEPWARSLLPSLLQTADIVVPLGGDEGMDTGSATVVRSADELLRHFRSAASSTVHRLVLQNDWGLGDELLLSAVARELTRAHPDVKVWIRSRHGFRFPSYVQRGPMAPDARVVETIYQNATLYSPRHHSPFPGHLVQQMLDKVALDTGLVVTARDTRPELDLRPVLRTPDPTVILHSRPNPRLPSKDWGVPRWERLAILLRKAGVRLRQVGGKVEPLLPGAEDLRGLRAAEVPDIFAESWAVVCVVGFLMHLAAATDTPAVVIYGGREHPAIDGYPDQVHLSSGPLECRGRWGCHLAPDLDCPHGMKCMEQLTPELVAREVESVLARGGRR